MANNELYICISSYNLNGVEETLKNDPESLNREFLVNTILLEDDLLLNSSRE